MMNILIVEGQWLLSSAVEEAVLSLGHEAIGTATTAKEAYELLDTAEVAFVDVNLIGDTMGPGDRPTSGSRRRTVGLQDRQSATARVRPRRRSRRDLKAGDDLELVETIQYATDHHAGRDRIAPKRFIVFH